MLNPVLLCVSCNRKVQEGIFTDDFTVTFMKVILPLLVLAPLLYYYNKSIQDTHASTGETKRAPVIVFSLLIGIGMGGFIDGIVLHQILQVHQMLSNKINPTTFEGKSINMFWDGIFEAVTWVLTSVGIILMWHARKRNDLELSNNLFVGGLIAGWGVFNLMDSIFNHYIFRFHNVIEIVPDPGLWNIGFLMLSLLLILIGWIIIKRK